MLSKFVWILASIRISGFLFGTGQGFSEECNSRMVARIAFLRRLLKYAELLKSQSLFVGHTCFLHCFQVQTNSPILVYMLFDHAVKAIVYQLGVLDTVARLSQVWF